MLPDIKIYVLSNGDTFSFDVPNSVERKNYSFRSPLTIKAFSEDIQTTTPYIIVTDKTGARHKITFSYFKNIINNCKINKGTIEEEDWSFTQDTTNKYTKQYSLCRRSTAIEDADKIYATNFWVSFVSSKPLESYTDRLVEFLNQEYKEEPNTPIVNLAYALMHNAPKTFLDRFITYQIKKLIFNAILKTNLSINAKINLRHLFETAIIVAKMIKVTSSFILDKMQEPSGVRQIMTVEESV